MNEEDDIEEILIEDDIRDPDSENLFEDDIRDPYSENLIEDDIREPDIPYSENLIDDNNTFNNVDDELSLALKASREEYIINNNGIDHDEEYRLALEISKEEHFNIIEENVKKESIFEEELMFKKIEIDFRRDSLSNFCKKIQGLSYTAEDIKIKKYIENVLDEYFELKINSVNVDKNTYTLLYKIIDSYYLIPSSKNQKKTAISKEEDTIIRTIFLD